MTETDDAWAAHVRQVVSTLRPEDFQPWNDVSLGNGRTLAEARLAFVPDVLRRQVSMHLAMLDAGIERRDGIEGLYAQCWTLLLDRLRRKEVWMDGCQFNQTEVQQISPRLLGNPKPDFVANEITCNGVTFGSVLLRLAETGGGTTTYRTGTVGRPTTRNLWEPEFHARARRKELAKSATAEGKALAAWVKNKHPEATAPTPKTIEEVIRADYGRYTGKRQIPG